MFELFVLAIEIYTNSVLACLTIYRFYDEQLPRYITPQRVSVFVV